MLTIRTEHEDDLASIRDVHSSAFPTDAEARLVDRLRAGGKAVVSLVAAMEGRIVGHILFSPVSLALEDAAGPGVGLAPVAVSPPHQRQGIGSRLITAGIAACGQARSAFIVVLGEPAFYERFGFQPASKFGLSSQYDAGDAFMALELVPGSLSRCAGLVRYGREFQELDD